MIAFLTLGMMLSGGAFFGGIYYSSCLAEDMGMKLSLLRPIA